MAVNDPEHPELARERQDVDVPNAPLVAEKNFQTGRGGAGNIHHLTEEERAQAKEHNQHVRATSQGRRNSKERDHLRELAEKGKEKLFGHRDSKP
ncbi:hypothetical protein EPUS_03484 [Endocarpon pusillum Z07020]|uniref:Uncharacterized protein n=1 Tax=Endocarpon pusillum (strain Z07020 / HMAS-L-300199) TaxID=1263415 RepID=U1HM16_ENDPU|nr:uncharacterized protein EPUS_03484 [Endocarpon pusillum Z07020]ERF71330.1 hypothetical protein EPUS_03484 [Endocarpon pusillum Z07020]